jgi:hypothetical protein
MARIRSVHPGIWTDESFVEVSAYARLLLIGLGAEADDKGIFPWKPTMLKMRLMPADDVDVTALLGELEGVKLVCKYEIDGVVYGAIRNFRIHQRPKKPNDIYPITDCVRNFVGLSDVSSPLVPHQYPTSAEISPQMEDVGCRMEKKEEPTVLCAKKDSHGSGFEKFWTAWQGKPARWKTHAKKPALAAWQRLTAEDRDRACGAIVAYQSDCKAKAHDPKHAERYLRDRVFENYDISAAVKVFTVKRGSPEWEAWRAAKTATGSRFIPDNLTVPTLMPPEPERKSA